MVTMENAWILPALPLSAFIILALLNFVGIAQNLPRKGDFIAIIAIVLAFFGFLSVSIDLFDQLPRTGTALVNNTSGFDWVHIPEIDRDIVLHPQQAYFYNGYTRRDARRRGIDGLVRRALFERLRFEGFTRVCSYVRRENAAGLRAASRWQRPTGTIRYIAVRGRKPIVMRASTVSPQNLLLESPAAHVRSD